MDLLQKLIGMIFFGKLFLRQNNNFLSEKSWSQLNRRLIQFKYFKPIFFLNFTLSSFASFLLLCLQKQSNFIIYLSSTSTKRRFLRLFPCLSLLFLSFVSEHCKHTTHSLLSAHRTTIVGSGKRKHRKISQKHHLRCHNICSLYANAISVRIASR